MRCSRLLAAPLLAASIAGWGCSEDPAGPGGDEAERVFAIVDVMTLNHYETVPPGYTGVHFSACTDPYVPDVAGEPTVPSDVNAGIGGDTKFIWVKYEELPVDSDVEVLVEIAVAHWPYWCPDCPEGWVPAGPLTTGTWSDCWRNGLNARYLPLRETGVFVSTLCLSITRSSGGNSCPDSVLACGQYLPRETCPLDIHRACGDDNYVYLSSYRSAIVR